MSDQQEQQPGGILGDVQSVKRNGAASLTELREFIGALKGRKPQDVMGEMASNGLVQGIIMSSIGFVVVLLVFTAFPFFLAEDEPLVQPEATPTASPARRTNINMMEHDASTLELKAQILQVAALTDRGQRLNTLSEWHASNGRPTH